MDAHNGQLASVLLLKFPQLRKYMHTVNSTVRPEVQDEYLAVEVRKLQRTICVQPIEAGREVGRIDRACKLSWTHFINPRF